MAVVRIDKLWQKSASNTADGRTYSENYLVECDSPDDDIAVVFQSPDFPWRGAQHPTDTAAYVISHEVTSEKQYGPNETRDGGGFYKITVNYSTDESQTEPAKTGSPYYPSVPPKYHWIPAAEDRPVDFEIDDEEEDPVAIKNILNRPYLVPVTRRLPFPVLEITVQVAGSAVEDYLSFNGYVNEDPFYFGAPGQCLAWVEAEGPFDFNTGIGGIILKYWVLRISVGFNLEGEWGWHAHLLQQDIHEAGGENGSKPIIIDEFKETSQPYCLNDEGKAIIPGTPTEDDDVQFKTHKIYPKKSFGPLDL